MILEKVTDTEKNQVQLDVAIPAEDFEAAVEASYKKNIRKMNVPGFRAGKAPRKMVEKLYGESVFWDDAVNALYPEAYDAAVREAKIDPVDRPEIEITEINAQGFKFTAKVTIKPVVEVKEYKGLKVEQTSTDVTDEDLDKEVNGYLSRNARIIDVEGRATKMGDSVVFDFEGFVDDVPFDGGKAEGFTLKLGSGQFIPGFEEQMVDKNVGDEFDVNVTFPEDYHEETLKGKPAVFKIKLHNIKEEELPTLDDDFVKDVSDFDTVDAFKEDLKTKIKERKEHQADHELRHTLSDMIADLVVADIPECMFENETDSAMQNFAHRLSSQGISLEQYAQFTGSDMNSMRAMFKDTAIRDVKLRLALEKIAELEQIAVSDEEVEEEYKKLAAGIKSEVAKIKSDYVTESIIKDLRVEKAFECVRNNAEISVKAE